MDVKSKRAPRTRGNGQGTVFKMPNGKWRAEITRGWREVRAADGTTRKKRIVKTKSGFKFKRDAIAAISDMWDAPIKAGCLITSRYEHAVVVPARYPFAGCRYIFA